MNVVGECVNHGRVSENVTAFPQGMFRRHVDLGH